MNVRVAIGALVCVTCTTLAACGKELVGADGVGGEGGTGGTNPTTSNMTTTAGGAGGAGASGPTTTSGFGPCVLDQSNLDECLLQ